MQRGMVLDIQQFKGIRKMTGNNRDPFVNCYYTPILSVVNYYKKSIFPVIINPFFYYERVSRISYPTGYLRVKIENINKLSLILNTMGIESYYSTPKPEEILSYIRENIESGSPILVNIDMFYQKGRDEYYRKKHDGKHVILIYGYNDLDQTINFLDDVNGYSEYTMKYEELMVYYKGLFDYCNISYNLGNTTCAFIKGDYNQFNKAESRINQIKEFSAAIIKNKRKIIVGLEELQYLIQIQHNIKNDESILSALSSTIQRKKSQKYQYLYLDKLGVFPPNYKIEMENYLNTIINNWTVVRNIIGKSVYQGIYLQNSKNTVIDFIDDIYEKERLFHTHLYSIIENGNTKLTID